MNLDHKTLISRESTIESLKQVNEPQKKIVKVRKLKTLREMNEEMVEREQQNKREFSSESDFKSQPRRIVWCASLAKRLEANAETALELESALRILRLTAESEAVREHLIAKSKAWQQIESFVMASLGDFSQRRKEFMLKLLTRREPEVLVETYRQLPNSDLALVAIVRSEL